MSLKPKHFFSVAAVLLVVLAVFNFSLAADGKIKLNEARAVNLWGDWFDRTVGQKGFNDLGFGRNDPRTIIANVVNIAFGLLGVAAIILLMYGGFVWMTAGGDADKVNRAKVILRNAAAGLLIILSAFALAIYVLSRLMLAVTGQGGIPGGNRNQGAGALGALGAGIIKSVYPAPEARDVPRNTSIIITFREAIDPASICDKVAGGRCAADAKLNAANVRLYKTDQGDDDSSNLTDVRAFSADNRMFVFSPASFLGSPSEKIWYSVALTEAVKKANGAPAFSLGGFQWKFEVSNKLDLTPPQVVSGGIFPPPDSAQDTVDSVTEALQAKGAITVRRAPQVYEAVSVAYSKTNPASVELNVGNPGSNACDGQIDLSINNTTPLTANLAYRNLPGKVDEPQAAIVNRTIVTACGFSITLDPGFAVGHSWRLTVISQKQADYLVVGPARYTFVDKTPQTNEILVNAVTDILANNIAVALAGNASVTAAASGPRVNLIAKTAGRTGNALALASSADYTALALEPFSGGADKAINLTVAGKPDQPRNAVIQVNFNEAVNPLTVSGPSAAVADFIRVVNMADNSTVAGEFTVANQYQTVEFVPSTECGVNACGDKIYCLPAGGQLRVELTAASLAAVCATDNDCLTKTPYNTCAGGVCSDSKTNTKYPEGRPDTGIADLANNSLDGNRDAAARGPVSFFDENSPVAGEGDSYRWAFWVSDQLDLASPQIINTDAAQGQENVATDKPVTLTFDKLMMASTLTSGSVTLNNGVKTVTHKLVNLWSQSKEPIGYWITKADRDTSSPPDSAPDRTTVFINHSQFYPATIYRAQAGSGLKDIYQNCFKPCRGPGCEAGQNNASCCNGVPTLLGDNGSCP